MLPLHRSIACVAIFSFAAGACRSSAPTEPAITLPSAAPTRERPRLETVLAGAFSDQYYAIRIAGKHVGYDRRSTLVDPATGEYVQQDESEVRLVEDGEETVLASREVRRFAAAPPHSLLRAESMEMQGDKATKRALEFTQEGWRLTTTENGQSSSVAIEEPSEQLEQVFFQMRAAIDGEPPFECEFVAFDLEQGRMRSTRLLSKGTSPAGSNDGAEPGRRVDSIVVGEDSATELEFSASGRLLSSRMPGLGEAVAVEEASARGSSVSVDLQEEFSVPVIGLSKRAHGAGRMRLEWSGADALLPEREFQHVRWLEEGRTQEIVLERPASPSRGEMARPVPEEVRPFLAAEPGCEVDDPRLRELVPVVAPAEKNVWERARAVVRWVDRKIEDSYSSNRSTALGVLAAGAGDCTEHALLACALLRACGIPAREVGGVMLEDGKSPAFRQHAWVEVWIGRWIPVDPTWSQSPADATHVFYGDENAMRFLATRGMSARVISLER